MNRNQNIRLYSKPPTLTASDVARITKISRSSIGIELGAQTITFIRARLDQQVKKLGLHSYSEYCTRLENVSAKQEQSDFSEALTTNTTQFFRETKHFEWLRTTEIEDLANTVVGGVPELTIWSAACSTGQELYSALMVVDSALKSKSVRYLGIGTDISQTVLGAARHAVYDECEIAKIPKNYRSEYLLSSKSSDGRYRITPKIRHRTEWDKVNLIDHKSMDGIQADLIFLRNVLIYFNKATQDLVLKNVLSRLRPGGILMTGHTETHGLRLRELHSIRPTIYQKAGR